MTQNIIILILYLIIFGACLAFLVSYKLKRTYSLMANAIWFIVFGQLIAYSFQIYRIIDHLYTGKPELYGVDYIIGYIFMGRVPEIIGISIFLAIFFSMNYRKK